jgi:hypothetical protein
MTEYTLPAPTGLHERRYRHLGGGVLEICTPKKTIRVKADILGRPRVLSEDGTMQDVELVCYSTIFWHEFSRATLDSDAPELCVKIV